MKLFNGMELVDTRDLKIWGYILKLIELDNK